MRVEEVAKNKGVDIAMEKVEGIQKIMTYHVMSTPAVIVEGQLVHARGIPSKEKVEGWF